MDGLDTARFVRTSPNNNNAAAQDGPRTTDRTDGGLVRPPYLSGPWAVIGKRPMVLFRQSGPVYGLITPKRAGMELCVPMW